MRIALVNQWYPPHSGYGGVAMYNYYLSHALIQLGHRVIVIACRRSADVPAKHDDYGATVYRLLSRERYPLRRLPLLGRYARPAQQLLYSWKVAGKLREIEQTEGLDVVEFAEVNAEGFFYLLRRHKVPVVIRCHTPTFVLRRYYRPEEMPFDTTITTFLEKFCIRHADALTTPSHNMARVIAAECGVPLQRITVVPNALDTEEFRPARSKHNPGDEIVILHVGRLERGKGVQVLAEAIPRVLRAVPQSRFVFVGDDRPMPDGRSRIAALREHFAALGLDSRVELRGHVSQAELLAAYAQADICVVPSLIYESFSYACAQAMACGLPVVASRIGGISETVEDGVTGILVEPGDVQGLAQAIVWLAQDRELRERMGAAGRAKVEELYAPSRVAKMNLVVYEQASSNFQERQ
jgi:glycosyltransferase involved in cell wall biosynthesis